MPTRISSQLNNNQTQYNLRRQEVRRAKIDKQIGTQSRISSLRDDPIAAGHLVKYQSYKNRVEKFEKNASILSDQYLYREGYMTNSLEIMQRVRELAVTGSNGIYTKDDMRNMAVEVNELLGELLQNANAVAPDGNSLFAGTNTNIRAFDVDMGAIEGSTVPLISAVHYNGSIDQNKVEVDENKYITVESAGNRIFWAEPQRLFGGRDSREWQAQQDSVISVDGQKINVESGDNVYSLMAKINSSGAAVKASLDPVTHGLNLSTTDARQLWLEDVSGSALNELGIIKDSSQRPPYNIGDSVRVTGGSLFDTVIALRDAMFAGDNEEIGGRVLASLDSGINTLVTRVAKSGSEYERLQNDMTRNSAVALNVTGQISREGDLDLTKAITDEKMLEYTQNATLSTAGKMYSSTLLNYMR
ncbi:flagellar hook-associated protein 3 [uncultured Treponema sp.]|uniref:flagellar hook-associated protein 3 n=1 Tax=uncultured Treponema sp. TaxID=162155 RepID=UPI0025DE7E64|nr:flagellar hook-associated protein 3 [uncultured Treponema sp.]